MNSVTRAACADIATLARPSSIESRTATYSCTKANRVLREKAPYGTITLYSSDTAGNVTSVQRGVPKGNPESISFTPSGTITVAWIIGANNAQSNEFLADDSMQALVSVPPLGAMTDLRRSLIHTAEAMR